MEEKKAKTLDECFTVIEEYKSEVEKNKAYPNEKMLEDEFIFNLKREGYEYANIKCEKDLISNLRVQLEKLNNFHFSNNEWEMFYREKISNGNDDIVEKTRKIQQDYIQTLILDDGAVKNIKLIEKEIIDKNALQVINQYREENGNYKARYDVTILVNGLPLVHVELKNQGKNIREAFNQINRYSRKNFGEGDGLFQYVQLFVISNGSETKYYSNTTRERHIKDENNFKSKTTTSNSFEFTSYWTDEKNNVISHLVDFTKTFFKKHSLLNIITKYCVFTSENLLLVMRPYQIVATEKIINKIKLSMHLSAAGSVEARGYIWHSTGSGKTLTSFKTAQLATGLKGICKVLFVVDRKDLDYQTMKEYDRFEKGAADSNNSTKMLEEQLKDKDVKIIITTIQKLGRFVKKYREHSIYNEHVVIIFDECHRSQFGDMHKEITDSFKKYYLFGFTGTPIFAINSNSGKYVNLKTTDQTFGERLHTYTIVNAIKDKNVLPFHVSYVETMKMKEEIKDKMILKIDSESALYSKERISLIVKYVLEHFNDKTYRKKFQNIVSDDELFQKDSPFEGKQSKKHFNGFNAIFAVQSIEAAKRYYSEFKKQNERSSDKLFISIIFSFNPNEDQNEEANNGFVDIDESMDLDGLDKDSRDFLQEAIKDYNEYFNVSYDTSNEKFSSYYKDVSMRMKNREIDLLIVVNMFLTGFDSTMLNTLFVDKNLKQHGLIQAFSRTNRILNSVKSYGNIICFRDLKKEVDEALGLYGDSSINSVVLLKTYDEYMKGYDDENGRHVLGYLELIEKLKNEFPLEKNFESGEGEAEFIKLFGKILRLQNILRCFDESKNVKTMEEPSDFQDYKGRYIDLSQKYRKEKKGDGERINDDVVFEIGLITEIDVDVDYILFLVKKYHNSNCKDKKILLDIEKTITGSLELRSKKELIFAFIKKMNPKTDVVKDWKRFVDEEAEKDLKEIIEKEHLKERETREFMKYAFIDGEMKTIGRAIDGILPPISRFTQTGNRMEKKEIVLFKLKKFFMKFYNIIS